MLLHPCQVCFSADQYLPVTPVPSGNAVEIDCAAGKRESVEVGVGAGAEQALVACVAAGNGSVDATTDGGDGAVVGGNGLSAGAADGDTLQADHLAALLCHRLGGIEIDGIDLHAAEVLCFLRSVHDEADVLLPLGELHAPDAAVVETAYLSLFAVAADVEVLEADEQPLSHWHESPLVGAVDADEAEQNGNIPKSTGVSSTSDADSEPKAETVVKVTKTESEYFNTVSQNVPGTSLITAIIDENVKAMEGSRVRLRLLDDVEIGGLFVPKGTYLYATMSGFGKQRVKGKIESVFVGDQIKTISLSIYDTDGLEGLYVPSSSFRETTKDIGSSAVQQSMSLDGSSSKNSVSQWAGQAIQQAYQRTSQAISKAIRKNKVKLKYGTRVYLINGKQLKSDKK